MQPRGSALRHRDGEQSIIRAGIEHDLVACANSTTSSSTKSSSSARRARRRTFSRLATLGPGAYRSNQLAETLDRSSPELRSIPDQSLKKDVIVALAIDRRRVALEARALRANAIDIAT